ncbi:MAG TPA: hypothetical protein GXZ59_07325, partial [Clostridiaceae bacterium]|nr:hypothetical protein [Clostridiaceae bacterium]
MTLNSVQIVYGLTKPNVLEVAAGDTYTIDLPEFFDKDHDTSSSPTSIIIEDVQIGTFIIKNGQVIITFNEHADDFDNQEFFVNVSGTFDTDVFLGVEEVDIIVPYSDGTSFEATIRAEQEEYEGEDKKTPGIGYYFNDQDEKVYLGEDGKNPTHVDWTVRVNDNAETLSNVKIVDGLGSGLTLVADSFVVERIIRDYQNNETKEVVPEGEYTVTPDDVGPGFTLEFIDDNISHAYDITYTTALTKPDGGGDRDFNNTARIIYEGNTEGKDVSNEFEGTWSETLPVIVKEGSATDDPHRLDWTVRYNFGKENLGTVTLTDTLSTGHGALIPGTLLVYEVNTDIDGNIVGELGDPIDDEDLDIDIDGGTFSINDLDANGKAYYITFSTSVPVGLNDVGITNTIADDAGDDPNTASDTVTVNTIPTGGKVGEQLVDEEGNPYIEWTITMNTEKVNVGSIRVYDVFNPGGTNPDYLDFDTSDTSLFELYKDGNKDENLISYDDFSIWDYTHTEDDEHNGKTGFELLIPNAGPHKYEFVYRTYYTVTGMNQPHLANEATLLFLQGGDGSGPGIGDPIPGTSPDYSITGPKAGIEKSGYYVHPENTVGTEDETTQLIQWSIVINESRILFDELEVSDKLTSDNKANFTYDQTSFVVEDISNAASPETLTSGDDYTLTFDPDGSGFTITFIDYDSSTGKGILPSNAKFRISYTTSVDDTTNLEHENEASLVWQGGTEKKGDTVPERTSGIDKAADITIDANGNKIINWTIDFNSEENVLKNVKLTDKYSSVGSKPEESSIKLYKLVGFDYVEQTLAGTAITFDDDEGTFTVDIGDIDAVPYRLTYTSTLSAAQELENAVSNSAKITYTGNTEGETDSKEIPKPELVIDKNATDLEKPSADNDLTKPQISWSIAVNIGEDSTNPNNIVNLQNAVLKDIIPGDQSLLIDTIVVSRVGDTDFVLDDDAITAGENDFSIELPDGAYGYLVTFKTEILEYPAFSYAYSDEIEDLG